MIASRAARSCSSRSSRPSRSRRARYAELSAMSSSAYGRRPPLPAQVRIAAAKRAGSIRRAASSPRKRPRVGAKAGDRAAGARARRRVCATAERASARRACSPSGRSTQAGAACDLADQAAERFDTRADSRAGLGELAAVVLGVDRAWDDEDRLARQRRAVALEDHMCFRGVRRARDEGEGHGQSMVADRPVRRRAGFESLQNDPGRPGRTLISERGS